VVGSAWGAYAAGQFSIYVFVLALFATVCVHAASNVLNDVGDESIGTDPMNEQRIYPYTGGSRFIQTGILSPRRMARLGITLLVLATLYFDKDFLVGIYITLGSTAIFILVTRMMNMHDTFDTIIDGFKVDYDEPGDR